MRTKLSVLTVLVAAILAAIAGWAMGNRSVIPPNPALSQLPNLDRPVTVLTQIPPEAAAQAVQRIEGVTAELRKDDNSYTGWLELALMRKAIGDYGAAEEIWIYMTAQWPDDSTAYSNLADLYLVAFRDNARAETYLLRAIQKDPTQVMFYENAYSFYRFVKKDLPRAEQILKEGIQKNPRNVEGLKKLLADLEAG